MLVNSQSPKLNAACRVPAATATKAAVAGGVPRVGGVLATRGNSARLDEERARSHSAKARRRGKDPSHVTRATVAALSFPSRRMDTSPPPPVPEEKAPLRIKLATEKLPAPYLPMATQLPPTTSGSSSAAPEDLSPSAFNYPQQQLQMNFEPLASERQRSELLASELVYQPPIACLAPDSPLGRRVCVCRTPTKLSEPVGNVRFQQPTLEEVLEALQVLSVSATTSSLTTRATINGKSDGVKPLTRNWIVWELSSHRESAAQQMAADFSNQMLPYRVNDSGLLPMSLISSFVSTIICWLHIDPGNVAVVMFYEDSASYLCLLTCLLLALEAFSLRTGKTRKTPPPRVQDVLQYIDSSLFKRDLLGYQRSPTSYKTNCMEPFMVQPSQWPPGRSRCLRDFQSLLEMNPERDLLPMKVFELKSVSVENFLGPLEGLSVEFYHVFTTKLSDGKLQEVAKKKRLEQHREKKKVKTSSSTQRGELVHNHSFLSLTRTLDTPSRASVGSRSHHRRERSESNVCPSMASSRSRISPAIEKEDDLIWDAMDRFLSQRKECTGGDKPELLFNCFGGFKHHSKPRPPWDDMSTVLVPTVESRRVRMETCQQRESTCSATYNFLSLSPKVKKKGKGTEDSAGNTPVGATVLCGDILVVLRQKVPQTEESLRSWSGGDSRARRHSSDPSAPSLRKPAPVIALYTFHTSFLPDEMLSLTAADFELYTFADSRLLRTPVASAPAFTVNLLLSHKAVDREDFASPPDDLLELDSCKAHSISDDDLTDPSSNPFGSAPHHMPTRSTPMRTTVPALDMARITLGGSPELQLNPSNRKRRPFYHQIWAGIKSNYDTTMLSPTSSPRANELTNRSRKWPTMLTRTARGAREDRELAAAEATLLQTSWWRDFCLWRGAHCPLLTTPERDLEEFCLRHIVGVDASELLKWPEEHGLEPSEAVCCLKVSDNMLTSIMYALKHFCEEEDDEEEDTPGPSLQSESTTFMEDEEQDRAKPRKGKRGKRGTGLINKLKFKRMLFTAPGKSESKKKSISPSFFESNKPAPLAGDASFSHEQRLIKVAQPGSAREDELSSPSSFLQTSSPEPCSSPSVPPISLRRVSLPETFPVSEGRKMTRFSLSKPAFLNIPPAVLLERGSAPVLTPLAAEAPASGNSLKPPGMHPAAAALSAAFAGGALAQRRTLEPARTSDRPKALPVPKKKAPPPNGAGGLAALFAKKAAQAAAPAGPKGNAPLGRRLFWKPLENLEDTIFDELENDQHDHPNFDVDSTLMSKVFIKANKKSPAKPTKKEEDTKSYTSIMDPKRAQNVGIVVLRLRLPADVLATNLCSLIADPKLSTDDLQKLEGILFTSEEDRDLMAYLKDNGDPEGLREIPERKLLPLRSECVPRGQERCRILVFNEKWRIFAAELSGNLELLEAASQEMRRSKTFRQVLSVVLKWGNFVNYGAMPELQIKAITLSSLLKLTEFKTTMDTSVTSLHYILANMLASAPNVNLQAMSAEMTTVKAAAKIGGDTLEAAWKQINEGASLLRTEKSKFGSFYKGGGEKNLGYERLDEMLTSVEIELSRLEVQAQRTLGLVMSTAKFFGDDSVPNSVAGKQGINFSFGSVFSTFHSFLRKFDEAILDIGRRPQVYVKVVPEENVDALMSFCERISGRPRKSLNSPPKAISHEKTPSTKHSSPPPLKPSLVSTPVPLPMRKAAPPIVTPPSSSPSPSPPASSESEPPVSARLISVHAPAKPVSRESLSSKPVSRESLSSKPVSRESLSSTRYPKIVRVNSPTRAAVTPAKPTPTKLTPKSPPARLRKSEGSLGRAVLEQSGYLGRAVHMRTVSRASPTHDTRATASAPPQTVEAGPSLNNLYTLR